MVTGSVGGTSSRQAGSCASVSVAWLLSAGGGRSPTRSVPLGGPSSLAGHLVPSHQRKPGPSALGYHPGAVAVGPQRVPSHQRKPGPSGLGYQPGAGGVTAKLPHRRFGALSSSVASPSGSAAMLAGRVTSASVATGVAGGQTARPWCWQKRGRQTSRRKRADTRRYPSRAFAHLRPSSPLFATSSSLSGVLRARMMVFNETVARERNQPKDRSPFWSTLVRLNAKPMTTQNADFKHGASMRRASLCVPPRAAQVSRPSEMP